MHTQHRFGSLVAAGLDSLVLALVLTLAASTAAGQGAGTAQGSGAGVNREAMWPAPTAEDWKRPCLITWQRSYEDALAVSRETKKAILVCINMDGEIASEHYAGVRYRQPEIAALYEPYVCVIASVYRHNPRDYDEEGRRIVCPRFGMVTCGEHISIEPGLFDQFMDGRRIAPRHIGVELDSAEMYDVFYAWDTDTIFNSLRDGIAKRTTVPINIVRDDRPIVERVASRDIHDRTAVESAYQQGDSAQRRALLQAAIAQGGAAPVDLLRLAVFGFDLELAKLARRALAQSTSESAIDLIAEALRVPMDTSERDALIAALVRLGESFPRARTLAAVYQGLASHSSAVDVESWSRALKDASAALPAIDSYTVESRLSGQARASESRPDDATLRLQLAEAFLTAAVDPKAGRKYARLRFEDGRRAALEAEKLGASDWRVSSAIAIAAYNLGDRDTAYARAESAVGGLPPDERGWNSSALLAIFAEARQQAILKALREKTNWPSQWLTDVHAAYSVLARHPLGTDVHVVSHYDFLRSLGAAGQAARVLDEGLARFPDSGLMHDRLRGRILAERGVDGLESAYEARLREPNASANLEWFAGYASLVAAEFHRRAGREAPAIAAYDRGIVHYERVIEKNPEGRASADHFIALALAGRARLAYEGADYERALAELLASFERKPEAAASLDGLNISPVDTAKMLRARLTEEKRDTLVATLQTALDKLDPELLKLPPYEREVPDPSATDGRPPRRRRAPSDR